jgi:hypothetical protein
MAEQFDARWEYWTGDPEVEEFLAEEMSPSALRPEHRMPGAFFDNRGYGFIRPKVPHDPTTSPQRKRFFQRGASFIRRGYSEAIFAVFGHLKQYGPNTVQGIALSQGLSVYTINSLLRRKAGLMFKVIGRAPLRKRKGPPPLVWSVVTDQESKAFNSGERASSEFLTDRRTMFINFPGVPPKARKRAEPFTWIAA